MKKLIAAATTLAMFVPGLAFADMNSSSMTISTENRGSIDNTTSASAKTGDNWAGGSKGGRGGSGGDVEAEDGDNNNGGAEAGNGGNGGNASAGGLVTTGDATAEAGTLNSLNTTAVDVDLGGENMNSSSLAVVTDNDNCNNIDNETRARARTGSNDAAGSEGGKGGSGGDVEADDNGDNNNGGADAGSGGSGGSGGLGGEVGTGDAVAEAGDVNVLNTTLVRVRI